jgi:hypothetical protein
MANGQKVQIFKKCVEKFRMVPVPFSLFFTSYTPCSMEGEVDYEFVNLKTSVWLSTRK